MKFLIINNQFSEFTDEIIKDFAIENHILYNNLFIAEYVLLFIILTNIIRNRLS